jgi:TM2 domain-containing membrane protein YozV
MMKDPAPPGWAPKQKVVAGILGILLGGLGVHSFYLGNTKKGLIQIAATALTCGFGSFWGLIEGILILVGSENCRTDAYGFFLTD